MSMPISISMEPKAVGTEATFRLSRSDRSGLLRHVLLQVVHFRVRWSRLHRSRRNQRRGRFSDILGLLLGLGVVEVGVVNTLDGSNHRAIVSLNLDFLRLKFGREGAIRIPVFTTFDFTTND